ncbi:cytochrome b-c1 complex subunit 7-like [Diachasmimorpha longicaudata]|uniref:cytochrome b-c1 complex subunit 7-like n=1 Tax=Diachasmimorpha longicaudata TaxID=58733 RepID=UPI0030B88510
MAARNPNFIVKTGWKKWAYNLSRFNQYGLRHEDCIWESPEVKEALRRLPADILDERNFRIVRAMQLCCNKVVLPQEQWTKFEEDIPYLRPYLEEVKREIQEKKDWDKQ